jgi:hypothetical protein
MRIQLQRRARTEPAILMSYALVYIGRDETNPDHRQWGGPGSACPPGTRFPIVDGEPFTLGRSVSASIRCPSNGIARLHVRGVLAGDVFSFHDLSSTNGTWKDGVRLERGTLVPGERLALCGVFVFELQRE